MRGFASLGQRHSRLIATIERNAASDWLLAVCILVSGSRCPFAFEELLLRW
jgi:hypothetical protein